MPKNEDPPLHPLPHHCDFIEKTTAAAVQNLRVITASR
jgi:hypothetical protein